LNGKEALKPKNGNQDEVLKSLVEQFSDPALKSSTRILILISLALNKKLRFVDLMLLTGTGKGSLSNHLDKLEAAGYVKRKPLVTVRGPRIAVEITQKGLLVYANFVKLIGQIKQ
jgi:DNA-binding MarR family transcriptional regulator